MVRLGNLKVILTLIIAACIAFQALPASDKALFDSRVPAVVSIVLAMGYALEKYLQRSIGTDEGGK